jgi:hypothetical protein
MGLADPQSVTLGSAISLPRVVTGATNATYRAADGLAAMEVTQTSFIRKGEPRSRSLVKVTRRKISTDVLTDVKSYIDATIYVTFDRPDIGFTEAELIELLTGVNTNLTASTNANLKKVLGRES